MDGSKTTTTALLLEHELEGEPLPAAGRRQRLLGSRGEAVAVIETTGYRLARLAEVPLEHVLGEGEGHTDVVGWRRDHEQFWHSAAFRESVGDPEFRVQDDTLVVLETLRCLEVLDDAG